MIKIKLISFTALVLMCFSMLQAQNDSLVNKEKPTDYETLMNSNYKSPKPGKVVQTEIDTKTKTKRNRKRSYSGNWVVGAGINMVEDSGNQQFSDFFTLKNKNYGGVPIMVSAEYLTNNLLSFSTTILLNKYQAGKPVQGNIIQDGEEPNYMAVDFAAKLFFRKILYKHVFTPYMTAGPGVRFIDGYQALDPTDNLVEIPKSKDVTINVGFGAFYWIGRTWGINFNYVAKISVKAGSNKIDKSNHLVPSFGIFYRFKND